MNFVLAFRVPHPQSLNILWSLAVEEQFYLLWPLAVYFLSEEALAWTAAAVVVAAPLLRWFCTPLFAYHWPIYALTPFRMDLLAVGALIAIVWRWHQDRVKKFGHYGLLFTALALLTLLALSQIPGFTTTANTPATNLGIYELSLIACAGTILWALSGRATSILTLSPVRYVGRISYTIYLIHFTIFVLVSRYLHGAWIITGATLAGTLAYAAASWAILEKPILNRRSVSAPSATPETYVGSWSTGNPAIEAMSSILSGERERPSEEKVLLDAFPLPR